MENKALLEKVRKLGYPLFEKEEEVDVNVTLAEVVESRNLRLWEGFPFLLANAMEQGLFDYAKAKSLLKKPADRKCLSQLSAVSLALYETLGLSFAWTKAFLRDFSVKACYETAAEQFKRNKDLLVGNKALSPQRLKDTFSNYFRENGLKLSEFAVMKEDFDVEYALSQVFSPKQKELFFKKLKGEKLTKTEREYYSRAVKKKVMALANSGLHRLAQKIN